MESPPDFIPVPAPGQFSLVVIPHRSSKPLLEVVARLAQRAPLRVLDGGNRFNVHRVARALRLETQEVEAILSRIQVARAFTCYQVVNLLSQTAALPQPTLVLDLLATFRDESVAMDERRRLLGICLGQLRRLSNQAALVVSVTPQGTQDDELLIVLEEAADQLWRFEPPLPLLPLRLF